MLHDDIRFRYSGGASNNSPSSSTGGAISSHELPRDTPAWAGESIPGITLVDALYGPDSGTLVLTTDGSAKLLSWAPSHGEPSEPVDVTAPGAYWLVPEVGALKVQVGSIGPDAEAGVTIARAMNALLPPIYQEATLPPHDDTRCAYAMNTGASTVRVIATLGRPQAFGTLVFGLGATGEQPTAPPELTAGFTSWTAALAAGHYADLPPGQFVSIWLRRNIRTLLPSATTGAGGQINLIGMQL